jgi:peptide/nickel transport system permease protein
MSTDAEIGLRPADVSRPADRSSRRQRFARHLGSGRLGPEGIAGLALLILLAASFALVPMLSRYSPTAIVGAPLQSPSAQHLFGTDTLGRDIFARTFAAGWTDLQIVLLGVVLSMAIGTTVGVALGLSRSRALHAIVLRFIDAVLAIPFVILVLSLVVVLGSGRSLFGLKPGVATVVIALVVVSWTVFARLSFAMTLTLRDRESVIAARLLGYSSGRILFRHIVPAVIGVSLSQAATMAVLTIGTTASLAFLGAGIQDPTPELGAMMQLGTPVVSTAWWVTIFPGIAVVLVGTGFALLADALAEQ